jgi:cyanate lyase
VALFEAKARKGLTFDQIASEIGKDEVWVAAAFYGQVGIHFIRFALGDNYRQAKFSEEDLRKVCEVLGVDSTAALSQIGNHWWPNRGLGPVPPQDPVIYRLYEVSI